MAEEGQVLLTGAQLRAARALVGIGTEALAMASKVGTRTINRAESVDGIVPITAANAQRLIETLQRRGVVFLPSNGGGPGVRLRRRPA
jgi:histidine ammonia-lyase